jgi:hypothetical protein
MVRVGAGFDLQVGMDPVGHVAQEQPGPLLALVLDILREVASAGVHGGLHVGV